jgi:DNA-directed RNA polymerase specialized sigma24 family protein
VVDKEADAREEIAKLLALLVRLQVGSQAEAIVELNKVGIGPSRIATLLGTTAGTVNVAISRAKNRPKRALDNA